MGGRINTNAKAAYLYFPSTALTVIGTLKSQRFLAYPCGSNKKGHDELAFATYYDGSCITLSILGSTLAGLYMSNDFMKPFAVISILSLLWRFIPC
jgi:hypothetical protein